MPAFLAAMDAPRRNLTLALGASLLIHAVVLAVRFTPPDFIDKARERALDVILVNSKSKSRPDKAQAKAQTNLDGGGNTDEDRRAKTPLPPSERSREGRELIETQRRVAELEAQQQQMMTRLKSEKTVALQKTQTNPTPDPKPARSGADLASSALAMLQLEGEIARNIDAYNKKPHRKIISARTVAVPEAMYVNAVVEKLERIGTLNFPPAARGTTYGKVMVTLVIKSDGSLYAFELERPSDKKVLNAAAERIAWMSQPFPKVPPEVLGGQEAVSITRWWSFTNEDFKTSATR